MSIKENIIKLEKEIPDNVNILLATKTRSIEQIKQAIDTGITEFGENYVQEAEKKYQEIKQQHQITLYFIGHLQKNKINRALKIFDVINIDNFEIAQEINKRTNKKIKVTLEINIGNEPQKAGCKPDEVEDLIKRISKLENIELIGLMAMVPLSEDPEKTRPYFKQMKDIFDKVNNDQIKILSMGMTDDYKIAIQEGSNMIRVGSLIFN